MLRPLKVLVAITQPLNEISEIVIPQNCGSGVWPYLGTVVRRNELGLILQNLNLPVYGFFPSNRFQIHDGIVTQSWHVRVWPGTQQTQGM